MKFKPGNVVKIIDIYHPRKGHLLVINTALINSSTGLYSYSVDWCALSRDENPNFKIHFSHYDYKFRYTSGWGDHHFELVREYFCDTCESFDICIHKVGDLL